MKRFRITAISEKTELLNDLVVEKFKELKLLKDVKVVDVNSNLNSQNANSNTLFKMQKINVESFPIKGVDFKLNYNANRVDYLLTLNDEEELDKTVVKFLFQTLDKTKQFNRYAIELRKSVDSVDNKKLLDAIQTEIGTLESFIVNIINSSTTEINTHNYNFTKRVENEGYDLKNIIEINNNPSKEEAEYFIIDIDNIMDMIENE